MAVIVIIIAVVVLTAGIISWKFAKKTPAPAQEAVVVQSAPAAKTQSTIMSSDWKTYTSKYFNASISLPSDWKLVLPGDGSLVEPNENIFEGDLKYGFLASFSSPDKKEKITFTNGPLNTADSHKCETAYSHVNNQTIREVTCSNTVPDEIPGRYNYAFDVKNLVLIADKKTDITDKIITLVKFSDDSNKCTTESGKAGFIVDGRTKCYVPGENIIDTDCIVSSTGGCEPLDQ